MSLIAVLGRQPELGLAELESLLGADKIVRFIEPNFVELNEDFNLSWAKRLGGSLKITKTIQTIDSTNWPTISNEVLIFCQKYETELPAGKLTIGISNYGLNVSKNDLKKLSSNIKQSLKDNGRSVRLVPNSEPIMNSAQVLHNRLTTDKGLDICLFRVKNTTLLCLTKWGQDIIAYTKRDQARPMRDARVGMLPPKLAQIIINLAAGPIAKKTNHLILDPFCGTGVILQEAALMGYDVYGTDLEPRMIDYSKENLEWLQRRFKIDFEYSLEQGNAINKAWHSPNSIEFIATETFLGTPMSQNVDISSIQNEQNKLQKLLLEALKNLSKQIQPGTRCCFAVPAWFIKNKTLTLSIIDHLTDIGYNVVDFKYVKPQSLIYHRQDQVVGRHLITCVKN